MKKAILLTLQFFLFLGVFLVGSFLHPFRLQWSVTHPTTNSTHYFVPDGLIIMLALFAVILIGELLAKRFRAGTLTTVAVLFALIVGLLAKFGSVTHDLY
jgi:xanthine/uracil permease